MPAGPAGQRDLAFAVPADAGGAAQPGRFCLTPRGGPVALGGDARRRQRDQVAPTLAGLDVPTRVGVWFRPPAGERRTLLSLPARRSRTAPRCSGPGWVGPVDVLGDPAARSRRRAGYASLRLLARALAGERPRVPVALAVGLVGARQRRGVRDAHAGRSRRRTSPTTSPTCSSSARPATGRRATARAARSRRRRWSRSTASALLDRRAVRRAAAVARGGPRSLARRRSAKPLGRDDGGGGDAPPPRTGRGYYLRRPRPPTSPRATAAFFASLWAMRLVSALLGAVTARVHRALHARARCRAPRPARPRSAGCSSRSCRSSRSCPAPSTTTRGSRRSSARRAVARPRAAVRARAAVAHDGSALGAALRRSSSSSRQTGIALYPAIVVAIALAALLHARPAGAARPRRGGRAASRRRGSRVMLVDQLVTPVRCRARRAAALIAAGGVVGPRSTARRSC